MRIVILSLLFASTVHAAEPLDQRWQLGLRAGSLIPDSSLDPTDGLIGIASLRRALDPDQDLELELGYDELDFGIDYNLRHRFVGFNYLRVNREPLWDPYVLMGLGGIRYDAPTGIRSGNSFYASVGLGGRWELKPQRLFLRAEARLRYDFLNSDQPGQDGFGDVALTAGVEVALGQ
jgi:hypothetical protein